MFKQLIPILLTGCSVAGAADPGQVVDCRQVTIEFSTEIRVCPMPDGATCYLTDAGAISCLKPETAPTGERAFTEGQGPTVDPRTDGYDGREPVIDSEPKTESEVLR